MRKIHIMLVVAALLAMACNVHAQKKQVKPVKTEAKNDTLTVIKKRVAAGDATAMNILGSWYYTGQYVDRDYKQAASLFTKAADKGNAQAIGNMAMCYQTGNGLKKDSVMAVKLYEKSLTEGNTDLVAHHEKMAKEGSAFSGMLLYDVYTNGIGVKADQQKAVSNLKYASDTGSTDAQLKYGLVCMNTKNFQVAATVFNKLAAKKHPTGIYYTGYLLFKGLGVQQDKAKGLSYLEQAAALNMPNACYYLGKAYLDGDGIGKDEAKAVTLLEKAAVSPTIPDAKWTLALCYLEGNGVKQNYANAAKWFSEVAANKDYAAKFKALIAEKKQANFLSYLQGMKDYYINKDYPAAMKTFKALEKTKNPEAVTMKALCLLNEDYDKHNSKKGLQVLETVADNSPLAAYNLGVIYDKGVLVDKNTEKAVSMLEKAVEGGNGEAVCLMGVKYFDGAGVPQDYVKAAKYLLRAEAMNSLTPDAAKKLVACYKNKVSGLPDLRNAEERIKHLSSVKENNALNDLLRTIQ